MFRRLAEPDRWFIALVWLALCGLAGEARLIGWLLQTKALIMIIFANILLDRAVIGPDTFTALVLMATFSTMLTIPMVSRRVGVAG